MKSCKCLFLTIFVFLPSILFSQILVSDDADIFINGFPILSETMNALEFEDDYFVQIQNFMEYLEHIIQTTFEDERTINDDDFNRLKIEYQKVLQINPPRELNDVFIKLGWDSNGHKKFMTIIFGSMLLFLQEVQEEFELLGFEIFLNLFDQSDLAIIKENMDELISVLM